MLKTDVPTREQLVQRAASLAPVLKKHAAWSEENRRLHEETIEALQAVVTAHRNTTLRGKQKRHSCREVV